MSKKQVNFRLDTDVVTLLDLLVSYYSNETGVKLDRTKVVEKLIRDKSRNLHAPL